ncbi:MarR family transcriptional regulator [Lentzea flava]|uniref:MarR family transcriptional regulator n=1 Tax=Lentzea flava TaxID=103732 RepID=UPI00166FEB0F|nr:MarR family transcriptional regulator [Lentzea flava]
MDSPGSPGADTLLLSSGLIGEEDWAAALIESVETRSLQAALVARGVTPARVQDVTAAAVLDGAFAVAAGEIERHSVDESVEHPLLPASTAVAPDVLLVETASRLDALASLPFPLSPYRDRVVAVHGAEPATAEQREIVEHATGRRNARDIAFALGLGLHSVTVEISRMLADGLLEIAPPTTSFSFSHWGLTSLHPRAPREVEC